MERLNKKQIINQKANQTNLYSNKYNTCLEQSICVQLSIMRPKILTSNPFQIFKYMSVSFSNSSFDPFEKIPRKQDGDALSFNKTKK